MAVCRHNTQRNTPETKTKGWNEDSFTEILVWNALISQDGNWCIPWRNTQILTKRSLLRNVMLFHGRHVNVISFTTVRKVRTSLCRFSRNSYMSNSNMRRSLYTEFHPNRKIDAVSTDRIHLRRLSLCRFSRNSQSLNILLWKSRILIFSNRIKN